eukprot:766980-Hanusia_phi.AAC.7
MDNIVRLRMGPGIFERQIFDFKAWLVQQASGQTMQGRNVWVLVWRCELQQMKFDTFRSLRVYPNRC